MKILHVVEHLSPGGLEKLVIDLAKKQKDCKHQVYIFVYGSSRSWVSLAREYNLEVIEAPQKRSGFNFLVLLALFYHSLKFDIIHSHDIGPLVYSGLTAIFYKWFGKKYFHTAHGLVHQTNKNIFYENFFSFFYNAYACVSAEILSSFRQKTTRQLVLIPNGVELTPKKDKSELLKKYRQEFPQINFSNKNLIYVARVTISKNQKFLIDVISSCLDYNLFLVGPIQDLDYYKNIYKNQNNIFFLGERNDISDLLEISDIYVSSSIQEGLSLSVLEAMGKKIPCLLSNISGHRAIAGNNQEYALLYEENNSKDFLLKLSEIHTINVETTYKNVSENYSLDKMAKSYEQIYKDL